MTQRYLQKRQKLKEATAAQAKKEVDRKASKNRKIRYIVHERIINFMTVQDNLQMGEGRDAIVNNLFGVHAQSDAVAKPVYKKDAIKLI